MRLPSIRQIECFLALTETLNFRRAAEACYVTQPALSAQIQQLEEILGVRLFERDKRRVLPTAAGDSLVETARRVLVQLRDVADTAAALQQPLHGPLRLGIIPTVAPYILPRVLRDVREQHPHLELVVRESQTDDLLRLLDAGSLDVLLLALIPKLGGVETLPLFDDPFVLLMRDEHPMASHDSAMEHDLQQEPVLLLDDGHCLRDQALSICERVQASEVDGFRAASLTTLVQMVSAGLGVTLLPQMSLDVELARNGTLAVLPFDEHGPSRTIGLAWRPSSPRKSEYELLAQTLTSCARVCARKVS